MQGTARPGYRQNASRTEVPEGGASGMTYEPDRQLSDARALSAQWSRLARRSAAQGHGWLAAHAQVAADVEALRGLLVQRVVPAASDPEQRYAEAAAVLSDALA